MGILAAFVTVGLLAVAVTGVMNSFSDGEILSAGKLNTNFQTLKTAVEAVDTRLATLEAIVNQPSLPTMKLIYETNVTSATTSINITGLNGDVDTEYQLICRINSNTGGGTYFLVQPNNDTTSGNYISRGVWGEFAGNANSDANNYGGIFIGHTFAANQTIQSFSFVYAKTGLIRHINSMQTSHGDVSNLATGLYSGTWLNSASNITLLKIVSTTANGIGAGSHIELWARR